MSKEKAFLSIFVTVEETFIILYQVQESCDEPYVQVYLRLDQPLAALEVYRTGLDSFPAEVTLLVGVARVQVPTRIQQIFVHIYKR